MARALKVCSQAGCPTLVESGRCPDCTKAGRKTTDQRRGTAAQRGYNSATWRAARAACLRRDPLCVCTDTRHGHGRECLTASTVADHWPTDRRALVAAGVGDPDALHRLRGLCSSCHNRHTAAAQPGGWHRAS